MSSAQPEHVRQTRAAIDHHVAALDAARARLDRATSFDARMAGLRLIEAALSDLGRHVGETRRIAISAHRERELKGLLT